MEVAYGRNLKTLSYRVETNSIAVHDGFSVPLVKDLLVEGCAEDELDVGRYFYARAVEGALSRHELEGTVLVTLSVLYKNDFNTNREECTILVQFQSGY